jgi:hypothetical protein
VADIICPICGNSNPENRETCVFCNGRLKPVNDQFIKPGQEPVIEGTANIGDEQSTPSDQIHPGESPPLKNTSDLEGSLPSWLQSLRENKDSRAGESSTSNIPGRNLSPGSDLNTNLESMREKPDESSQSNSSIAGTGSNEYTGSSLPQASGSGHEELPDWLQSLQSQTDNEENAAVPSEGGGGSPDWLDSLISESPANETGKRSGSLPNEQESPNWLDSLKAKSAAIRKDDQPVPAPSAQPQNAPDWLAGPPGNPEPTPPSVNPIESAIPAENLPDWLNQLKGKSIDPESPSDKNPEPTEKNPINPDWLSSPGSEASKPATPSAEKIPDWLSTADGKNYAESQEGLGIPGEEHSSIAPENKIPDWVTQFHSDSAGKADEESRVEPLNVPSDPTTQKEDAGALPDWLAGIRPASEEDSSGTHALISNADIFASNDGDESAFVLETPDWLSKITPEQATEKQPASNAERSGLDNPEVSELPSWVQAMRPVESVVGEARQDSEGGAGVTEQSGPLAGLNGVLPVGPGIGLLSKPPAYSVRLQATEGQQRYAAALEDLINNEGQPKTIKTTRIVTNRLWRWSISILLILSVGIPLVTKTPLSQPGVLESPEMKDAFSSISSLQPNAPVLVVFDYSPALSGEVEAAATPLIDQLLSMNPRITLISTSPTGPALAERFLSDTQVSPTVAGYNYQPDQQYVDLGYLAGGQSGIQFFALSPEKAAPFTLGRKPAWQTAPLQGIEKLSDFATILILTDDAETGRIWIEQTSSAIGGIPVLMVISAQAEPMLLPYYYSGQIKGLVTGLVGGEAYAQTYNRPDGQMGPIQNYWNSLSIGVLIAESMIILGALWYALSSWIAPGSKKAKKA